MRVCSCTAGRCATRVAVCAHQLRDIAMAELVVLLLESRPDLGALLGDDGALLRRRLACANVANQIPVETRTRASPVRVYTRCREGFSCERDLCSLLPRCGGTPSAAAPRPHAQPRRPPSRAPSRLTRATDLPPPPRREYGRLPIPRRFPKPTRTTQGPPPPPQRLIACSWQPQQLEGMACEVAASYARRILVVIAGSRAKRDSGGATRPQTAAGGRLSFRPGTPASSSMISLFWSLRRTRGFAPDRALANRGK